MIKLLLAYGCTKEELYKVFVVTPAKHIGIERPPELGVPARQAGPAMTPSASTAATSRATPRPRPACTAITPHPPRPVRGKGLPPLDRPSQDVLGRIDESGEDIAELAMRHVRPSRLIGSWAIRPGVMP